jgi:aryl-alcohol dehydrogenase-like predicted oxidoreductase
MSARIPGHATAEGTRRYAERATALVVDGHFRAFGDGLLVSSLGLGTYLGPDDDVTDQAYRKAVERALALGVNVLDSAVNYRHQRSERAVGAALGAVIGRGAAARDEIVVATKGGFIPFDGTMPRDPATWFKRTYLETGVVGPGDVVAGAHCMTPRYLADQLERSRANLGLETLDVYYVHNPETQLEEVERPEVLRRLRAAFELLEGAVQTGTIRRYGAATWNGFRQEPDARDYLSLPELVGLARQVAGEHHHFRAIQLPYNLAMPEAFTRANQQLDGRWVSTLAAAGALGVYVMTSASVYQGHLAQNLPPVVAEYLPGLRTDAQRALQFVRSTPGVGTALVGMKSVAHVEENTGVAVQAPVPWERFQRLFSPA